MKGLLEGIGIAIVIIAFAVSFKGCWEETKPVIGKNGWLVDARTSE